MGFCPAPVVRAGMNRAAFGVFADSVPGVWGGTAPGRFADFPCMTRSATLPARRERPA